MWGWTSWTQQSRRRRRRRKMDVGLDILDSAKLILYVKLPCKMGLETELNSPFAYWASIQYLFSFCLLLWLLLTTFSASSDELSFPRYPLPATEEFTRPAQYSAGWMAKNEGSTPKRLSCTTCFNALWFCYSPVHQMQQYYRLGVLDNCSGKWSALWDCLSLKTKPSSQVQEILEAREKEKPHIWTFRTPEEAQSHWKELFGHLDDME